MTKKQGTSSMRKRSTRFLSSTMFFVVLIMMFMPFTVFGEGEYDVNSPLVKTIANRLSMEGHEEHDIATCFTKQRYFEEIIDLLNDGYTEEEVMDYYISMYGEQGLRAPNKSGFSLLAWTTPFVGIAAVGIGIYARLRKKINKNPVDMIDEDIPFDETEKEILSSYIDEERKKYY